MGLQTRGSAGDSAGTRRRAGFAAGQRRSARPGVGGEEGPATGGGAGGQTSLSPAACLRGDEDGGAGGPATAAVVAVRRDGTGQDRSVCAPAEAGGGVGSASRRR